VQVALLVKASVRSVDQSLSCELSLIPRPVRARAIVALVLSGPASVHELFLGEFLQHSIIADFILITRVVPVCDVAEILKECPEADLELGPLTEVIFLPSMHATFALMPSQHVVVDTEVLVHQLHSFLALSGAHVVFSATPDEDCLVGNVRSVIDHVGVSFEVFVGVHLVD